RAWASRRRCVHCCAWSRPRAPRRPTTPPARARGARDVSLSPHCGERACPGRDTGVSRTEGPRRVRGTAQKSAPHPVRCCAAHHPLPARRGEGKRGCRCASAHLLLPHHLRQPQRVGGCGALLVVVEIAKGLFGLAVFLLANPNG